MTSARSACEKKSDGTLDKPGGSAEDWDVSCVTNMAEMFSSATAFNADLGDWVVSKVTDMQYMFNGATAFNRDLGDWDVSKVTDMESMFDGATAFNGDLGAWDVSKVTNMQNMFANATAFNGPLDWCVLNTVSATDMFEESACGSAEECGLTVVSDLGDC